MASEKAKSGYRYKAKGSDVFCDFNCSLSVRKTHSKTNAHSASKSKSKSKSS